MIFANACLVCLFASSLAVPVQRSTTGDQLLAAVEGGTAAGLSQATGDLLAKGVTKAIETSLTKLTPLITKGITSALSLIGKREEDNAGDLLLAALGTSAGTAIGTATGELAGDLLKQGVDQAIAKGIPKLTSLLGRLGRRNILADLGHDIILAVEKKILGVTKRNVMDQLLGLVNLGAGGEGPAAIDLSEIFGQLALGKR